jgi:glycosyltransferase involved in cell wall biosynthesis
LRIALDATPLATGVGTGGIARYTAQLAGALASEFPEDEFFLVSDQTFALPASAPNLRAGAQPSNILERRWWTCGLQRELKRQGAEVFHGVDFAAPFPATIPAVITVHDLSPWSTASWADDAWRQRTQRVRKRLPWLIRTGAAQHVITPSEAIRREVLRHFRIDERRVTAIPLAAASVFRPLAVEQGSYFLYVGMLEARKNVEGVIAAWSAVRERFAVDLVLAGPHREETPQPAPRSGLHRRGVVSEEELAALYSGAIALVYPSHYEGFGLPVLEAMQCGAPVIISSDPALVETAGEAGLRAASQAELVDAMQSLVENCQLRDEMRGRSIRRAAQFNWSRAARETHNIYRRMLAA